MTRLKSLMALAASLLFIASFTSAAAPITVTDMLNRSVTLPAPATSKIASLTDFPTSPLLFFI